MLAYVGRVAILLISNVPSLVERNVVARALSWATWWVRRCTVTDWWHSSEGSSRLVTSAMLSACGIPRRWRKRPIRNYGHLHGSWQ